MYIKKCMVLKNIFKNCQIIIKNRIKDNIKHCRSMVVKIIMKCSKILFQLTINN